MDTLPPSGCVHLSRMTSPPCEHHKWMAPNHCTTERVVCSKRQDFRNRNRNRKLQTSKAPLKSQAQGTSLFTSAASNQRGFPKNSPWEAQVRFPEGERMRQIRGVFQRIV